MRVWVFSGLVHVGDELREVNGNLIIHKRPDEISQILVKGAFVFIHLQRTVKLFYLP